MPIDYGNSPERIEPGIEDRLANKETPFKDNPAFPEDVPQGIPSNWEELLASKRFKDVIEKVKRYTGQEGNVTNQNTLMQLMGTMRQMMMSVLQFESQNKEYLDLPYIDLRVHTMK